MNIKKDESWFRTLGPMFLDYGQENRRILTSSTLNKLALSRERVQWISKKKKENLDSRHSPPIFLELEPENLKLPLQHWSSNIYSNWNFNIFIIPNWGTQAFHRFTFTFGMRLGPCLYDLLGQYQLGPLILGWGINTLWDFQKQPTGKKRKPLLLQGSWGAWLVRPSWLGPTPTPSP